MVNIDFLKLIKKDIFSRKFSSFLTLLAISFGIFLIFLILNISTNMQDSFNKEAEKFGSNLITVIPSKSDKIGDDKFLRDLKRISYVNELYPIYSKIIFVYDSSKKNPRKITIVSFPFSENSFKTFNLENNEKFSKIETKGSNIYVGVDFLEVLYDNKVNINSKVFLKNERFKIKGELKSTSSVSKDLNIYMSEKNYIKLFDNQFSRVMLEVNPNFDVGLKKEELITYFNKKYGTGLVEVKTLLEELDSFNKLIKIVSLLFYVLAIISLIVGLLGMFNIMYLIVNQRIKEIGIMKGIGATKNDILSYFIVFSGIFGIFGAILGIIFAIIILKIVSIVLADKLSFLEIKIIYLNIIYLVIFGFIIGLISGYLPSKKASKLNIIEAMKR